MTSVSITKPAAAQRQIDAAIQMLFSFIDILAVHTVIAAAHGIVKDLAKKRGGSSWEDPYDEALRMALTEFCQRDIGRIPSADELRDGVLRFKKPFRKLLNEPANFLKHANRDADRSLDEDNLQTDSLLFRTCGWYMDLGFESTTEMHAFSRWHLAVYPHERATSSKSKTTTCMTFYALSSLNLESFC